jgi:tRNA A-37 threonylcarbamoyl transferase component Bud32
VTTIYIDGARFRLAPAALVGQGGEAEIYDLGDGRVVKWWKPADHPDFEGLPDAQAAATRRIAEAPAKLRALPGNLPPAVVAPCMLAFTRRNGPVVGYVMPKVAGTALHAYGEPKWRRDHPVAGDDVVAALLALHDAIAGLHRAGIVIGDCNDLNVLVEGRGVHLIDVDSYQFGGFRCEMFSERFVDPRLCDAQLQPIAPHDTDSDWFAFAAMAFRSLLGVGPWGGVHQPAAASQRCPAAARPARRISVLGTEIVYPRAARSLAILPDELLAAFRAIFERDVRGPFPRAELERLRLRACATCGDEHARVRCPTCQTLAHLPPIAVNGRLRWQRLDDRPVAATVEVGHRPGRGVWLAGDALLRATREGATRIGSVLAGQTRAWLGAKLGIGFYRAGGYAVGFVFRPDRGTLDDRVALPRLRGQLVAADAVIGEDRGWLFLTLAEAGKLATTCIVIGADARVLAAETLADAAWLAGAGGACAAGAHLFVPTDDGIARVEVVQSAIAHTRTFPETAPLVGAGDQLALAPGGLAVARRRDSILLQLT